MEDIIAAISTPLGKGAVSIVRMSGKGCLEVAKQFFTSKSLCYEKITPRLLYLGNFNFLDGAKEKCMMVYFKAPFSYTGEDVVEFQLHGGTVITQMLLDQLLNNGARLAEAGEFSRRAFENGKISLDEAESIIEEINAQSSGELKATLMQTMGALKNEISKLQDYLTECIAKIEATLDYPEEDFEKSAKEEIFEIVKMCKSKIEEFITSSQKAQYLKNGINVAIVGSPNVGKSSLLNAMLGEERAIVTDIEGTTRDYSIGSCEYRGIKLNFIDTAGIRHSENEVEKIGIERSKKWAKEADVVLFVLDGSRQMSKEDKEIENSIKELENVIFIVNKSDRERILPKMKGEIEISALKQNNIEMIEEKIYNLIIEDKIDFNKQIITNERQINILKECKKTALELLSSSYQSMDIIAMQIKKLWNELGKITGQSENEQIIDLIFSKFCLGK